MKKKALLSNRLKSYTLAVGAVVLGVDEASANIIYTDEVPDFVGTVGAQYFLDLNNDGTDDFRIWHNGSSNLYISPLAATNDALGSGGATFAYPFALSSGAMISAGAGSWFNNGFAGGYQSLNYGSCSFGNWCTITVKYIGLRFDIGGFIHYGWVRLDVDASGANWVVKDYAYDDVPAIAIAAGAMGTPGMASVASGVTGTDIGDNQNGLDLEVTFNAGADESTINEYRVMIVKDASAATFDLLTAQAVIPANYLAVAPAGSPSYIQALSAIATDVDGDLIVNGAPYQVFVLSEADGVVATSDGLSSPSPVTLNTWATVALSVSGADVSDNFNGSDLEVTFDESADETTLSEYRIMVVKNGSAGAFDLLAAQAVISANYSAVAPAGSGTYTQTLATSATDVDGDPIANATAYKLFVLSIADGTIANLDDLSAPSASVTLWADASLASGVMGADINDNEDGSDMNVSFTAGSNESTIAHYRLMIVQQAAAGAFDLTAALAVPGGSYAAIVPTGAGSYSLDMAGSATDITGAGLVSYQPYQIFVVSIADGTVAQNDVMTAASPVVELILHANIALNVSATDVSNAGDGTDMKVNFNKATNEATLTEYRVMTVKTASAGAFDLTTAQTVSAANYDVILPTGSTSYPQTLSATSNDVDGDAIVENVAYKLFVMSVADGTTATLDSLSLVSNEVTLLSSVGISNWSQNDFNVFAANGLITIEGPEVTSSETYQVLDISGKVVLNGSRNSTRMVLDITAQAAGSYIVVVRSNKGIITKKVIR
ncbi:MAG: T9SS type A sorting domain-containing protein [Flavobacteriales bacterium]|nr:T9SS type A sorting domain-containing protein [Flavobacteriales bacterium]